MRSCADDIVRLFIALLYSGLVGHVMSVGKPAWSVPNELFVTFTPIVYHSGLVGQVTPVKRPSNPTVAPVVLAGKSLSA